MLATLNPKKKQRCAPANKFSDYILNCSSESDNDVPPTPKLKRDNQSIEQFRGTTIFLL